MAVITTFLIPVTCVSISKIIELEGKLKVQNMKNETQLLQIAIVEKDLQMKTKDLLLVEDNSRWNDIIVEYYTPVAQRIRADGFYP